MAARAWVAGAVGAACCLLAARPAGAVDAFEIQVYDGTADAPGTWGTELHSNVVATGPRAPAPDARDLARETHLTLEPSYGVTPIWELGAYLQTAIDAEGGYHYAGVKLRSKLVTPPDWRPHARLGVNLEVSWLPATYEPDRFGGEIRPIAAWENERWLMAVNPILDFSFGPGFGEGPSFEPAFMVKRKLGRWPVDAGIEYYASFGPPGNPLGWSQQQHTVFEAIDVAWRWFSLNAGLGLGLSPASEGLVVKAIFGYASDMGGGGY